MRSLFEEHRIVGYRARVAVEFNFLCGIIINNREVGFCVDILLYQAECLLILVGGSIVGKEKYSRLLFVYLYY